MGDPVRVLVLGTGQMGTGICRLVLEKDGLQLVGAFSRRGRSDLEVARELDLPAEAGIPVSGDLDALVVATKPRIAIQATCSTLDDAREEIGLLLAHGVHVISIAEEMVWPACRSAAVADEIAAQARVAGAGVLGTGINPGFVLDLLVIALSGVCSEVESITATRSNDLAPFGPTVLASQGVGLSPEEFEKGRREGMVRGHIGFPESVHMIAGTLGWEIDRLEEWREPIVSQVRRETPFVVVEPGQVAGCLHRAVAYREGTPVITLTHPQQIHPQLEGVETGDLIEIKGRPEIRLSGSPEIPGGEGTCSLAVNMIPRLLNAAPGLHTMADLPVPAAMLGDVRSLIDQRARH